MSPSTSLNDALRAFDAAEANLAKLERLWKEIESLLPTSAEFAAPPGYDEACFAFREILGALPAIDGFSVGDCLFEFDEAGRMHFDAMEVGDIEAQFHVSKELEQQGLQLKHYRLRLQSKRRALARGRLLDLLREIDGLLATRSEEDQAVASEAPKQLIGDLSEHVTEIDSLLGSGGRPPRWEDLHRHLHFARVGDLDDIRKLDWPIVHAWLATHAYGDNDPLPVPVTDLGSLVAAKPGGAVAAGLAWSTLSPEDFERLLFQIVSETDGYENAEWLQNTNAPDQGRDVSVWRVEQDPLSGTHRERVIIQCKHWMSNSIGQGEINTLRGQMELWQHPRVDRLIVATSGRFTADAIRFVEQHNQQDRALKISLWAESHLEQLLAKRPHLVAEFGLRPA